MGSVNWYNTCNWTWIRDWSYFRFKLSAGQFWSNYLSWSYV